MAALDHTVHAATVVRPDTIPRAKRVIWLFMHGGPSHVDLFDPKPVLTKYGGHPLPESFGQVMTRRKVADYVNREKAQKRGGGKVRGDSVGPPDSSGGAFDQFVSETPSPESVAMVEEETTRLLDLLPSEEHRQIALCRLEGNSVSETAEMLKLTVRTVERRLQQIRAIWAGELQGSEDSQNDDA